MTKYYIVWNPNKTEGFITDNQDDAEYVRTGEQLTFGVSSAGEAFRETYCDDDHDIEMPMQEIELP